MTKDEFIQELLQKLGEEKFDELFSKLKSVVKSRSFKQTEINLFQQQYSQMRQRKALGSMNSEHYERVLVQISASIEKFIRNLEEGDVKISFSPTPYASPFEPVEECGGFDSSSSFDYSSSFEDSGTFSDSNSFYGNAFADLEEEIPTMEEAPLSGKKRKLKKTYFVGIFLSLVGLLFGLFSILEEENWMDEGKPTTSCAEELVWVKSKTKSKVESGKLASAMSHIGEFAFLNEDESSDLSVLKSRLSRSTKDYNMGKITRSVKNVEENKIATSILDLCRGLECVGADPSVRPNPKPNPKNPKPLHRRQSPTNPNK